jgi:uncharacterized protein YaaN involved in tellurite resistance
VRVIPQTLSETYEQVRAALEAIVAATQEGRVAW